MKRKIDATNGTSYTYTFADGSKFTIYPGQENLTEEMIKELKRTDNRDYTNDLKNWGPEPTKEEKAQWEESHPGEKFPRKWNASFDFGGANGINETERNLYHQMSESQNDESYELLYEAIEQLPQKQKQVIELYLQNYKQTEIAAIMGISTSTVRDQLAAAKKNIKKNYR